MNTVEINDQFIAELNQEKANQGRQAMFSPKFVANAGKEITVQVLEQTITYIPGNERKDENGLSTGKFFNGSQAAIMYEGERLMIPFRHAAHLAGDWTKNGSLAQCKIEKPASIKLLISAERSTAPKDPSKPKRKYVTFE